LGTRANDWISVWLLEARTPTTCGGRTERRTRQIVLFCVALSCES
jgi:hypothetical protein